MTSRQRRPQGSLLAMPLVVVNLGVEMLYIIEQRLAAQKIPGSKAKLVIEDLTNALLNDQLVDVRHRHA